MKKITPLVRYILIYKEIQMRSVALAKSHMRKGFPIYEEMRKYLTIYEEAVSHIWLCNRSLLNFLIYEGNLIFFFISAYLYRSNNQAIRSQIWRRFSVLHGALKFAKFAGIRQIITRCSTVRYIFLHMWRNFWCNVNKSAKLYGKLRAVSMILSIPFCVLYLCDFLMVV